MEPSIIREIHNLAQSLKVQDPSRDLVELHFGESDQGTPDFIIEAACEALRQGAVFYENNSGRPELKCALAEHYNRLYGVKMTPDHFVVTCGGTQAIHLTMLALLSDGDAAINITPCWPNITQAARLSGAKVVEVPLRFDEEREVFELNLNELERIAESLPNLRMIIAASPGNPTGWVMTEQEQRDLYALCRRRGVTLMSDEIYSRILFADLAYPSALRLSDDLEGIVVIDGFSKSYCMTGWRIGYLIAHPDLTAEMARMQEFVVSCTPSAAQVAGITALRDGEPFLASSLDRYRRQRDSVSDRLNTISGVTIARCDGAFYSFFRIPGSEDSEQFCRDLLMQAGVVLAPGKALGEGGEGWLRLCFANDERLLHTALDRLEQYCR